VGHVSHLTLSPREGSFSSRWNPSPSPSAASASRTSSAAAASTGSIGRAGTGTSATVTTTEDGPAHDLREFGDMGAAARSYGGAGGRGGEGRPALPLETIPRLQDTNPYRLQHGLVVFDRSAMNSGE
jgi:hypothetical protein